MASMTIKDWKVIYLTRTEEIVVRKNGEDRKTIPAKKFRQDGLITFPKVLYKIICKDLRYANIYDKFSEKVLED